MSIVLENQGSSFLKSMELNVLDSLNTKLARPEGSSVHDGVPVPFQLPPGEPAITSRALQRPQGIVLSRHTTFLSLGHSLAYYQRGCKPPLRPRSVSPSPGISNEAQFVFTIQSIVMSQKLKGTLSFIAKVCGA